MTGVAHRNETHEVPEASGILHIAEG